MTLSKKGKDIYLVGGGFSEEALLVFALMSTELSAPLKKIINRFINSQVASGNWALLGQLFVVLDTQANSLTDWLGNQNGLAVNSPVFDAFDSWTFDGSTNYINCQLVLASIPNTALNDAEVGAWVVSHNAGGTQALVGSRVSSTRESNIRHSTNTLAKMNSGSVNTIIEAAMDSGTLYSVYRVDAVNQVIVKDGVGASLAISSNAESSQPYAWGARKTTGATDQFLNAKSALFYAGSGNIDTLNLFNNINIMITSIAALG